MLDCQFLQNAAFRNGNRLPREKSCESCQLRNTHTGFRLFVCLFVFVLFVCLFLFSFFFFFRWLTGRKTPAYLLTLLFSFLKICLCCFVSVYYFLTMFDSQQNV